MTVRVECAIFQSKEPLVAGLADFKVRTLLNQLQKNTDTSEFSYLRAHVM